jgi:hypothetical protein
MEVSAVIDSCEKANPPPKRRLVEPLGIDRVAALFDDGFPV